MNVISKCLVIAVPCLAVASYYVFKKYKAKSWGSKSDCNKCNIGKVETFKQPPPPPQQPPSPPPPQQPIPPLPQKLPQPPSPPPPQQPLPPLPQKLPQPPSPPPPQQPLPPLPQKLPQPPLPQKLPQPPPPQIQQKLTMPLVANGATTPNKPIKHDGEDSINLKTEEKRPVKRKNKNKKRQMNLCHLIYPKNPLMILSELFDNVQIVLQEHQVDANHNVSNYTATLEINDQTYSGNDIFETKAKQNACETFLSTMLVKQLNGQSAENASTSKSKGPPQEDFPWTLFASLAMNKLLDQWDLQADFKRANYVEEKSVSIKSLPNTGEKINNNARMSSLVCPKSPMAIFNQLFNRVPINLERHQVDPSQNVENYTATIEIDGQMYSESDISKTEAKKKACDNFLRSMLAKELSGRSTENASTSKSKGSPQEDFPWLLFASLAMNNLLDQWKLQP